MQYRNKSTCLFVSTDTARGAANGGAVGSGQLTRSVTLQFSLTSGTNSVTVSCTGNASNDLMVLTISGGVSVSAPYNFTGFTLRRTNPGFSKTTGDGGVGSAQVNDPIDLGSGNMYRHEVDFSMQGENGFSFTRYYNSLAGSNTVASSLGQHWRSTYDRFLRIISSGGQAAIITAERADGKELRFTKSGTAWVSDTDVDYALQPNGIYWILTDGNDDQELYQTSGSVAYLIRTQRRSSYRQDIAYNGTLPVSVADSFGRGMAFTYQSNLLKTVAMPGGLVVTYNYNS
ncbi:MAG TPA: DUF6531 domain-containing protein, partial [Verrucomicrobiae bacterium]|nr:DUF6531 domain-containing protein [Verrucomicrobiae bacterium]